MWDGKYAPLEGGGGRLVFKNWNFKRATKIHGCLPFQEQLLTIIVGKRFSISWHIAGDILNCPKKCNYMLIIKTALAVFILKSAIQPANESWRHIRKDQIANALFIIGVVGIGKWNVFGILNLLSISHQVIPGLRNGEMQLIKNIDVIVDTVRNSV